MGLNHLRAEVLQVPSPAMVHSISEKTTQEGEEKAWPRITFGASGFQMN